MGKDKEIDNISHLMRREIQAPIVAAIINGFAEKFGAEETHAIAKEIISKDAAQAGKDLAEKFSGNSLKELLRIVEEVWAKDDTMEIKNIKLNQDVLRFDVVRCGYAEMYQRLGIKKLGSLLSCCRDFAFMDGFNPKLKLVRTKTIMDGDDICDFCYKPR